MTSTCSPARGAWEGGQGRRVFQGAARPDHPPGSRGSGGPCQRHATTPPLLPSPSSWLLSCLYATTQIGTFTSQAAQQIQSLQEHLLSRVESVQSQALSQVDTLQQQLV